MPGKFVLEQKKCTALEKSKTTFKGIKSNAQRILWAQLEELMQDLWSLW
jgi:hypothetical protein